MEEITTKIQKLKERTARHKMLAEEKNDQKLYAYNCGKIWVYNEILELIEKYYGEKL